MATTLVVMQPTVLPWAGYFNLMQRASDFVFYDDVQLEKQSWQTRNRLLLEGRANWITLPVVHAGLNQLISETQIAPRNIWVERVKKSFVRNYKNHPFYKDALCVVELLFDNPNENLAVFNESIIEFIAQKLNIKTRTHRSSELNVEGKRSDRLIGLCSHFNAEVYLSPVGAREYLELDGFIKRTSSELVFQNFLPKPYPQINSKEFVPHLSILDVIANLGWEQTRSYVICDDFI